MLSLKLLGNVELFRDGELLHSFRSQKELALLIYLAQTGQAHRRDFVAELLWDSRSTKQALSNIRTALTRLQKQVGDVLVVTHRSLALAPELRQQVDSVVLLQMLAGIERITSADQAIALQTILDTYRDDFLADFHIRDAPRFDEWAIVTREYIRREVVAAYNKLGQHTLSVGDAEWGIAVARRWLQAEALDEAAHTLLIQQLIKVGNIHEATAHYDQYMALLQMELGVAPPEALMALIKDVRQTHIIKSRSKTPVRHNIPAPHDPFFGRKLAQQELHNRLNQPWCRLVTIVGPGGVGKTRLATTVARSRLNHYQDGIWLVELVDLDSHDDHLAESIAVEIATALDLRFTGSAPPIDQLLKHLQHKQMLLVLDNFEHLLAGFQIVLDIVQHCEYVQLLVTSREALQLRIEWTLALAGLSYPSSDTDATPAEAIELFAARHAQQQWDAISDDDLIAVRTICRMVEGLPLAIELAATLTRSITPQAVADRLRHSFDTLITPLRDVPQRHHSLQIVFEMSWRILPQALQQRLARLSVFRGGFSVVVAQQIAGADTQDLVALGDKSLLLRYGALDRYTLHPIIRAYAAKKLLATDPTQQQHAHYYLALLAQHTEALQKSNPQESIALFEPDIDNLRLAWQTGIVMRQADLLLSALTSFSIYYQMRGLAQEGESVMHTTIINAKTWGAESIGLAARAGLEQARFQNRLGRYWPATLTIKAALELASPSADRWVEAMGHVLWGESLWRLGEHESARNKLNYALTIARAIDSMFIIGWCYHHFGIIDDIQGYYDSAHAYLQQACAVWQSLENITILSASLNSVGLVCLHQGDLSVAQQTMDHALTLCTQIDNRHMQALLLNNLSMVAIRQGNFIGAQHYLQLGLALAIASGNLTGQGEIYINLGRNYSQLGEGDTALEHLEQGLRIAETLGNRSLMATAMLNLARAKREQADSKGVATLYYQALHIAQQDNLIHIKCELLIDMAELLSDDNLNQARKYSLEAVGLAEALKNAQLLERANMLAYQLNIPADLKKQTMSA